MVLDGEIAATRKSPAVGDLARFEGGASVGIRLTARFAAGPGGLFIPPISGGI
jgi:hypothetical protein